MTQRGTLTITPSLNEQRLEVVQMLRTILIDGHTIKLQELEYEISKLKAAISIEKEGNLALRGIPGQEY